MNTPQFNSPVLPNWGKSSTVDTQNNKLSATSGTQFDCVNLRDGVTLFTLRKTNHTVLDLTWIE